MMKGFQLNRVSDANPDRIERGEDIRSAAPTSTVAVDDKSSHSPSSKKAPPTEKDFTGKYIPRTFDVWALGLSTVLAGQVYGWNGGLAAGFGGYFIGQFLVGVAYIILVMCLAEICSTTTFSGGSYGMTRVVLGFYVGFLVAVFELMEYITYAASAVIFTAQFMCQELSWDPKYGLLICFVFLLVSILIVIEGDYIYWRVNYIIAIVSLLILVAYCLGSLYYTNFPRYAVFQPSDDDYYYYYSADGGISGVGNDTANATLSALNSTLGALLGGNDTNTITDDTSYPAMYGWFADGGMAAFMRALPWMTWGFAGIESSALVTDIIANPRESLSKGITLSCLTLFVCLMCLLFVGSALPPGVHQFANMPYFLTHGFEIMGLDRKYGVWALFPSQIGMVLGFMLPAAKLYHAISASHLLPPFMQIHHKRTNIEEDPSWMGYVTFNWKWFKHHFQIKTNSVHLASEKSTIKNNSTHNNAAVSSTKTTFETVEDQHHGKAAISVGIIAFGLCLLNYYRPEFSFSDTPLLLALFAYFSDLYAFYQLRTMFKTTSSTSDQAFVNPLGIPGCIFAALIFGLCAISMVGFKEETDFIEGKFVAGFFGAMTLYYFAYAKHIQKFSDEEQKTLLVLHVISNNRRRRKNHKAAKKRPSVSVASHQASV